LVTIGGKFCEEEDEDEGGLGEKDKVTHALAPEARFCVSTSQNALKLRYVCIEREAP
jgi:hypothetical protein